MQVPLLGQPHRIAPHGWLDEAGQAILRFVVVSGIYLFETFRTEGVAEGGV